MCQTSEVQTEWWRSRADQHLYQYVKYEGLIPRLQEKLLELKGAREIVNGSEWTAYQDETHSVLTHTIDLQILYVEECLKKYLGVRQDVETIFAVELKDPKYRMFINLYWGSRLARAEARNLVMKKLNLSQTTFYRWRKAILSKIELP